MLCGPRRLSTVVSFAVSELPICLNSYPVYSQDRLCGGGLSISGSQNCDPRAAPLHVGFKDHRRFPFFVSRFALSVFSLFLFGGLFSCSIFFISCQLAVWFLHCLFRVSFSFLFSFRRVCSCQSLLSLLLSREVALWYFCPLVVCVIREVPLLGPLNTIDRLKSQRKQRTKQCKLYPHQGRGDPD